VALRFKIGLLSALITGGILTAFGMASWFIVSRERLAAVDREIRTLSARHPGWFANRPNYERLTSMLEFTFGEERKGQVILQICDSTGAVLYRSPHWPEQLQIEGFGRPGVTQIPDQNRAASVKTNQAAGPSHGNGAGFGYGWGRGGAVAFGNVAFRTIQAGGISWRLGLMENTQKSLALGINCEQVQSELKQLRNSYLVIIPVALVLAGLGGWTVAGRALRPLQLIADTAEGVTARGLDQRIPLLDSDPEVARVIRVLNGMMDRLEKSFHQATRFSADASHELKTPLAIMQGELENALQLTEAGSREQVVYANLLEEVQQLKNITRTLLLLAQADAGRLQLALETIHLSEMLADVVEDARVLAAEKGLTFEVTIEPNLAVQGDRILLATSVLNLLSNAVQYNEPRGRVSVQCHRPDSRILLLIGNTGPGIPEPDQPRLFGRFFRAHQPGKDPVRGFGLGLSLAREIIRAHGGELQLQESRPGWTSFTVVL
jgi:two-component system, OmpR family, heavy metal sensor histidine kinase CusS